jgi:uncharacterized protein YmfQ (DUF2313 family)
MGRSTTNYLRLFQSLLPKGAAWNIEEGSGLSNLLQALGDEFVRIESRSDDLLDESVPTTVNELLEEHEEDFGITEPKPTTAERLAELKAKWIARGQQDPNFYFVTIADILGYTITITQFTPAWCGIVTAGQPCGDQWVLFRWLVNLDIDFPEHSFSPGFSMGFDSIDKDSRNFVKDQIRYIYDVIDEIDPIKPGHTIALYDFYNAGFSRGFDWGFKSFPHHDGSIPIESYTSGFSKAFAALGQYDGKYLVGGFHSGFNLGFNAHRGGAFSYKPFTTGFHKPS